jgi:transcriptional regulator with XRE-family HTH domain
MLPIQCKMARAALSLGVRELADAANVSPDTVARLERGEALRDGTVNAIRAALESAGVEFIAENGGGAGVRLKKPTPSAAAIESKIDELDAKAAALKPAASAPKSPEKALRTMKRAVMKNEAQKLKNKLTSAKTSKVLK